MNTEKKQSGYQKLKAELEAVKKERDIWQNLYESIKQAPDSAPEGELLPDPQESNG